MGRNQVTDIIHYTDEVILDGELIETTPEHPFYVEDKGWGNAEDLEMGDDIRQADGTTGEVESIETEQTSQEMYNLTVDEAHTFFVGDGQWLVHNACFWKTNSFDYRKTFFDAYPELEGQVVVHHAVEQQTLIRYPKVVTPEKIHSLENLRGIPFDVNSDVHLSQIRRIWNEFYRTHPNPSQVDLLQQAAKIDKQFRNVFLP